MQSDNIDQVSCYSWAGLNLRFICLPETLKKPVDKMFVLNQIPETDTGVDIRMTLEKGDAFFNAMPQGVKTIYSNLAPKEEPYIEYNKEQGFSVLLKGEELSAFAISQPPFSELLVASQEPETGKGPLLFNTVLIPSLRELLIIKGKALLHAGCVVSPAGDAVLIIADSGGGKTSTTITLTRQGFKFISDDLITLSLTDQGIMVEGIAKPVNLTRKTISFFPELEFLRARKERSGDYKIPVDPIQIFQKDGMAAQGIVKAVLIPRITKKGPAVTKMELQESLPILMKGHTFAHEAKKNDKSMQILWTLIEKCTILRLHTGHDPVGLGAWLAGQAAKGRLGFPYETVSPENVKKKHRPASPEGGTSIPPKEMAQWFHDMLSFSLSPSEPETVSPAINGTSPDMTSPKVFHKVWDLVKYHRLETFAAKWMMESKPGQAVPLWVDAKSIITDAKIRYLTLCNETVQVHHLLTQHHHDFMFIRGTGFANTYYPFAWQRHSRDIDIVCRQESIPEIEALLMDNGYQPIAFGTRDYWLDKGELPYRKNGITLEIHWDAYPMLPKRLNLSFSFKQCFETAQMVPLMETDIRCLNVNHLFLSSCLHAIWEHHFDRLLRMVDIRQMLEKDGKKIDWDWIQSYATKGHHKAVMTHFLSCLQHIVQADVPQQGLTQLKPVFFKNYLSRLELPWPSLMDNSRTSRFRRQLYTRIMHMI